MKKRHRHSLDLKSQAVNMHLVGNLPVSQISKKLKVSAPSIYKWLHESKNAYHLELIKRPLSKESFHREFDNGVAEADVISENIPISALAARINIIIFINLLILGILLYKSIG
jgi:transposase-like protein